MMDNKKLITFKNDVLDNYSKFINECEVREYIEYVKKNSGYKRVHYRLSE